MDFWYMKLEIKYSEIDLLFYLKTFKQFNRKICYGNYGTNLDLIRAI